MRQLISQQDLLQFKREKVKIVLHKVKKLFQSMNERGIPVPLFRLDGKPSLTATFAIISFNTALLGQIGKVTKILGAVDLSSANYLFFGCLAALLGRRMIGNGKSISVESKKQE
jgi:hypothetical protein